jgi:hypothetical protein
LRTAGLARVVVDDCGQRIVADRALLCREARRIELTRDQVATRDLQLLLRGVTRQLDDLHPVAQRPGIVSSTFAVQMNITPDRSNGTPR